MRNAAISGWLAARSSETPLPAKLLAAAVAGYAFSPIDLIPDFIPVLGMLDDLIIVPIGIRVALHLMPDALLVRFRAEAELLDAQPASWVAAGLVIGVWFTFILWLSWELLAYN